VRSSRCETSSGSRSCVSPSVELRTDAARRAAYGGACRRGTQRLSRRAQLHPYSEYIGFSRRRCGVCCGLEPPPAISWLFSLRSTPPLSSGPSVGSRYRDTFDSPQREARGLSLTCSILGDRHLCEANGAAARPRAASRAHRSHKRGAKRPPVWELPKWRRGVGRNARRKRGVFLQVPQRYLRLVQLRRRYRVGCTLLCTVCYRTMCTIGQRRLFDSPQIGDVFEFFLFQSAFEY